MDVGSRVERTKARSAVWGDEVVGDGNLFFGTE